MAREGPISFGKPLFFLVLIGCIGGGIYAYFHWPSVYEVVDGQSYWKVNWPHEWQWAPDGNPDQPDRMRAFGPLPEEKSGVGWSMTLPHGQLIWPDMVVAKIGGTPDLVLHDGVHIDNKKALIYEYEDNQTRFVGCAVERGDVLIYVNVGCNKADFAQFRGSLFEKVIQSVRCSR